MFKRKKKDTLERVVRLAAISGLRSMAAPALLSNFLTRHPSRKLSRTPLQFMQSRQTAKILNILAAAEMLGDKLPSTPNRIKPSLLLGRGLSGALVGATLSKATSRKKLGAAGLGFASAIASSYVAYYLRKSLSRNSMLPDTVWGAVEDIFVIQSGKRLLPK